MKKGKKRKTALYSNIVFALITLISLTITIVVLILNYSLKNQMDKLMNTNNDLKIEASKFLYTQDDYDEACLKVANEAFIKGHDELVSEMRERLIDGDSAYGMFRDIFTDDLIVYDSKEGYIFYPITDSLKHNDYKSENFVKDESTGEIQYVKDGTVVSKKGIDVSKHNGNIDWAKVKASGIDYAFIRVGYRGSTGGKLTLDETFEANIKGALDNGIDVGIYFFTQATNVEEAIEEARFVIDAIKGYNITYPVVWDIEELDGRTNDVDSNVRTDACLAFINEIENAGYKSMIYGNLKSFLYMMDVERLEGVDKWFAYYSYPDYYPYEYSIWQYTSDGNVDGINGKVDINICMKDYVK